MNIKFGIAHPSDALTNMLTEANGPLDDHEAFRRVVVTRVQNMTEDELKGLAECLGFVQDMMNGKEIAINFADDDTKLN